MQRLENQFSYDYNRILPVFLYTDPDIARSIAPEMDRAIEKSSKIITNKSITVKPKEGGGLFGRGDGDFHKQNEYNRWVRESYLLAGKAHFYKHDYIPAAQAFLFIIREYHMNPIRHEAKIWLARTYNERGRYNEARLLFEEMLNDPEFNSDLRVELYSTIADYHLKQDQLKEASVNLEKALENTRRKERRIRYTYILGQLYERSGNYHKASEYYGRVVSMNPPYEMAFNARISQTGVFQEGEGNVTNMINDLESMLKDDKNRDYQDQIYYALGNIYLRNNDEANALRYYAMSAAAAGPASSQKAVSYLALADIYFQYPDYITAQAYYDSAVTNMGQEFPDQRAIREKSNILRELVSNISLYELEDSLQFLAQMNEAGRNSKIDDIIARAKQEEADALEQERITQQTPQYQAARISQAARRQAERSGGGNWYFYNQSAVNFGQNEFESLWGNRQLEDNWRRSNRQVISTDEFALTDAEDLIDGTEDEEITDTESRDYYLRNIPLTEEDLQASHRRIQDALFNMGVIYRDDFQDYERSIEAYELLVSRYPEGIYTLSAYYDLYSVHLLNNDQRGAEFYKNLIVSRYPGSSYSAMLTNPDYFKEHKQKMLEAELYYENTFNLFREHKYAEVEERAVYASATWPESDLIPRFEYLRTLSYGSRGNIPLFREKLENYINTYPETEMAENAIQFVAYLEEDYPETISKSGLPVISDIYKPDQIGEHYFVVVVDNIQDMINRMVFNIVNFNVDQYARLNLNISSIGFSSNYQLLRVDGLTDIPAALDYMNRFSGSNQIFSETGSGDFPMFIISPENYNLFMQDKNIPSYLNFFNDEYLNR